MKKAVKETPKNSSSSRKKNTRRHTTKKTGYKEDVFDAEEQRKYDKTDVADNKRNTMGPRS
jgi:hypothetical protein